MDQNDSNNMNGFSPPRLTILLVSAMALSYEVLLMRLFSIIQYHHFAYMIISLALLGYGASGTFLVFFRQLLLLRFPFVLIGNIILFGITAVSCYFGGQHLLFNPDEMLWNSRQWFKLFALYLLLALPFFFAANCIALTFSQYRQKISEIYAADLCGAGLGSVLIIGLLFVLFPQKLLLLLGSITFLVGALAWFELRLQPRIWGLVFIIAAVVPFLLPASWTDLAISPYKGLSQQMRVKGSRIVDKQSSPLAFLTLVENELVPFRYMPGLSLTAQSEPPEQLAIFMDGGGLQVITRFPEDIERLNYLDRLTSALPYHLRNVHDILILGAGGGSAVLQAVYYEVPNIHAVELNPQVVQMVKEREEYSGNLFNRRDVQLSFSEARSFVAGNTKKYQLIQLPEPGSLGGSAVGFHGLHENYLFTKEAVQQYISHLQPEGILSMNCWIKLPPRDSLKLFVTAIAALRELGVKDPAAHLVMIRSLQSATLLVKRSPFGGREITALKEFSRDRLFDLVFYPGMDSHEANRYNILQQPYFHEGAVSLMQEGAGRFLSRYKFNIRPSTDDSPYFANFFKWQTLKEILKLKGKGGMALLESGYLILVLTLFQAIAASFLLVFLPVALKKLSKTSRSAWNRSRTAAYFFAIGMAFLFLEIAFIQKCILYLGHPLYAAAAVLAIFLIFAGLGSRFVQGKRFHVIRPVLLILILGVVELISISMLQDTLNWLPVPLKILSVVGLLSPLAFCMGMPFPLALAEIGSKAPDLIPWAWAVNGCGSVIAAVLATILAVHFGFATVVLIALMLYGFAAAVYKIKN